MDMELIRLAEEYVKVTERYDRRVCSTVNSHGVAVPTSHRELVNINIHAQNTKLRILLRNPHIDPRDFIKAIKEFYKQDRSNLW